VERLDGVRRQARRAATGQEIVPGRARHLVFDRPAISTINRASAARARAGPFSGATPRAFRGRYFDREAARWRALPTM